MMANGPYGVNLWKYIHLGWDKFSRLFKFEVGDDTKIKFYVKIWCGDEPWKNCFPKLYRIAHKKDAYVADHTHIRAESVHWEVNFTRMAHDWELESIYSASIKGVGRIRIARSLLRKVFRLGCIIVH